MGKCVRFGSIPIYYTLIATLIRTVIPGDASGKNHDTMLKLSSGDWGLKEDEEEREEKKVNLHQLE